MAKNFGQYDDENPVMTVLEKARQEQKNQSAADILKQTADNEKIKDEGIKPVIETPAPKKAEEQREIKKILMNISIRETTKKDWKMFFLEHDLTMTQGIETAVEYLRSEVEKGNIRLSKGGVTK